MEPYRIVQAEFTLILLLRALLLNFSDMQRNEFPKLPNY